MSGMSSTAFDWLLGQSAVVVVTVVWALLERRERMSLQRDFHQRSVQFSDACIQLVKDNSQERVQREEHHMLMHDSSMRNILDSLERAAKGKPPR